MSSGYTEQNCELNKERLRGYRRVVIQMMRWRMTGEPSTGRSSIGS